jgi:hypothetical protein
MAETEISGRVVLPNGVETPAGLLIVVVEDVTDLDSLAVRLCGSEMVVREADYDRHGGRSSLKFQFSCDLPEDDTRDLAISGSLHVHGERALQRGDFVTIATYPISARLQAPVVLELHAV